jgi:transcriptional regulator with XRE-family HTH domain
LVAQQNSVPEISNRLQKLMAKLKLTQAGLADKLGTSPATVSRWMKGTHEPTGESYVALGNLAGSPEANYFWERAGLELAGFPDRNPQAALSLKARLGDFALLRSSRLSNKATIKNTSAVIIPLLNITAYGDRVPPGPHVTLSQADIENVLVAPLDWCPHPESMISMRVSGDSMFPLIGSNAIIFVDTAIKDRDKLHLKLAVASHRNLGFKVARFQRLSSSDILASANHNCPPIDISDESKWKMVGEVLWWLSKDTKPTALQ